MMHAAQHVPRRAGFVLPAVLWIIVGLSVLTMAGIVAAREGLAAAHNRVELGRAAWRAEGCTEAARAAIDDALADENRADRGWRDLDSLVAGARADEQCELVARAAGAALDVNAADEDALASVLVSNAVPAPRADSLAAAIMDWRDPDAEPRAGGAERDAYRRARAPVPRDSSFASTAEILLVRGAASVPGLDTLLGAEPERVPLGRAPPAVLAALPGLVPETVARIIELRARGELPGELLALTASLSPGARAAFVARYAELSERATLAPDAWLLSACVSERADAPRACVELKLVRAGARAAVIRRRGE